MLKQCNFFPYYIKIKSKFCRLKISFNLFKILDFKKVMLKNINKSFMELKIYVMRNQILKIKYHSYN